MNLEGDGSWGIGTADKDIYGLLPGDILSLKIFAGCEGLGTVVINGCVQDRIKI